MTRILWLLSLLLAPLVSTLAAEEAQQDDVVYLNEAHAKPLPLKTKRRVELTEGPDSSGTLARLGRGETVWVLGFGKDRDYVEVRSGTGKTRGWVDEDALEAVPEPVREIEDEVRTAHRQKQLVARHEIEAGMTPSQVETALGKPTQTTRTQEGDVVEERWMYRTYKSVPQHDSFSVDGKVFDRIYYRQELVSGRTVTFRGGRVAEIKDDAKPSGAASTELVAPLLTSP